MSPSPPSLRPSLVALVVVLLLVANLWWYETHPGSGVVVPACGLGMALVLAGLARDAPRLRALEPWAIAMTAWLFLAVLWTSGRAHHIGRFVDLTPTTSPYGPLRGFFFFAGSSVVLRLLAPWGFAWVALGRRPADLGAGWGSPTRSTWMAYGGITVVALACVAWASQYAAFVSAYPRCRAAVVDGTLDVEVLLVYWAAYFLVFLSGEAFWRGYLLFGLAPSIGRAAILVQVVPYALVHFGKPQAEALGAIVAGLVLGHLALAHRSFWMGVIVHFTIAVAMDVAALAQRGIRLEW